MAGITTRTINSLFESYESRITELETELSTIETRHSEEVTALENEVAGLKTVLVNVEKEEQANFAYIKKYSYVLQEASADSGISVDLMYYLDEQCKRWDIPVTMMYAIMKIESTYNTNSTNSTSGARGLGNVMPETGELYWENVLGYGKGSFKTEMLYDPYVNVEIMCAHIGRNKNLSLYNNINRYSGGGGDYYYNKLIQYCKDYGFNLSDSTCYYGAD